MKQLRTCSLGQGNPESIRSSHTAEHCHSRFGQSPCVVVKSRSHQRLINTDQPRRKLWCSESHWPRLGPTSVQMPQERLFCHSDDGDAHDHGELNQHKWVWVKTLYLVNIKIAGKWMLIPLKCIYRYWPIPKWWLKQQTWWLKQQTWWLKQQKWG
jgi:hypothetical protein